MNNSLEIKLIILYFLSINKASINLSDITTFLSEKGFAEYMQSNQYLAELSETELIKGNKENNQVLYTITDLGKMTLDMFDDSISDENKNIIENYLK